MRGLAAIALLSSALLSGCELAIHPDGVPPPGSDGGIPPGSDGGSPGPGPGAGAHTVLAGRLSAAAGSSAGAGAHSVHAGSLGPVRSAGSPPPTGHWIREGRVDP